MNFSAVVIEKTETGQKVDLRSLTLADLMDGDVTIDVSHSSVNYKDALALTGRAPVVRRFPMVPGIDMAGTVSASSNPGFKVGDAVLLNGWGVGETHFGAYSQVARVKGDWLIHLPEGLSPAQAMAIGTAGYTAMLCKMALEHQGLTPADGPVVVTGAAGGVGSMAIALMSSAGWQVSAATGRTEEEDYLRALGATTVFHRDELNVPVKALAKEKWVAGIDSVGSSTLANLLSMIRYGGAVAACGLAGGMDLPTSVAPFILRGVSLLGIDSVMAPKARRVEAWRRLAIELDHSKLESITQTISLEQTLDIGEKLLAGQVRGRIVVEIR